MAGLGDGLNEVMGGNDEDVAHTAYIDPTAYQFGQDPNGAANERDHLLTQGNGYGGYGTGGFQNANAARAQQQQFLGQQQGYINQLQQAAAGNGPSAAQAQLQSGLNQANDQSMSMANSARGGPLAQAAAQRQGQFSQAQNAQNAANQSAQLRAQEQNAAMGQLGAAQGQYAQSLAQQRAQDLQGAGAAGNLQQGYEGMRTQVGEEQMRAYEAQQAQQSDNENYAQGINAQVSEGNSQRAAAAGTGIMGMVAAAGGAIAMSDARVKQGIHPLSGNATHAPMGGPPAYAPYGLGSVPTMQPAPSSVQVPRFAYSDQNLKNSIASVSAGDQSEAPVLKTQQVPNIAPPQSSGGGGGMAAMGSMMGGMMSDAHVKRDIAPRGGAVNDFLSNLHGYEYHYKPGVPNEDPNQQRYGIIAQQVQQSPMGASIVDKTPLGLAIDIPHATGAMLAGEGQLYARQQAEEQQIAALRAQLQRRLR